MQERKGKELCSRKPYKYFFFELLLFAHFLLIFACFGVVFLLLRL